MRRIMLMLLVAFALLPLLWAFVASFRSFGVHGGSLTLENYGALFGERDFWLPIRNSLIVAGTTTLFCVTVGSMAAYALARLRFPRKHLILGSILATTMFPQIAIVTPLFLLLRTLRLINTYPGLILPYITFAMPLCVWLLTGYFRQIPSDIDEAARMDGATRWIIFRRMIVPLSMPAIVTTAIITFIYCWNEFLFALAFTLDRDRQTVPVAIALLRGRYEVPWGQVLAAAIIATLPVCALVLAFQRRIVQGLTSGAVKG